MTYKGYTDPRYVTTAEDLHGRLDDVVLIDVRHRSELRVARRERWRGRKDYWRRHF